MFESLDSSPKKCLTATPTYKRRTIYILCSKKLQELLVPKIPPANADSTTYKGITTFASEDQSFLTPNRKAPIPTSLIK